jgi:hypothetical protein
MLESGSIAAWLRLLEMFRTVWTLMPNAFAIVFFATPALHAPRIVATCRFE